MQCRRIHFSFLLFLLKCLHRRRRTGLIAGRYDPSSTILNFLKLFGLLFIYAISDERGALQAKIHEVLCTLFLENKKIKGQWLSRLHKKTKNGAISPLAPAPSLKICRIFWPNRISNRDLYRKTGCLSVVMEIKRRRIRWLGHILRMDQARIPKVALRWTPPGKRTSGPVGQKPPGAELSWLRSVR